MIKISWQMLVVFALVVLFAACHNSDISDGTSINPQISSTTGMTGTYTFTSSTDRQNTCGGKTHPPAYIKVEQSGNKVTVTGPDNEQYTGDATGNTFTVTTSKQQSSGACQLSADAKMVGTVNGDNIELVTTATMTSSDGCEDFPPSCVIEISASGKRTSEAVAP